MELSNNTIRYIIIITTVLGIVFSSCNYGNDTPVVNTGCSNSPTTEIENNQQILHTDTFTTKTGKVFTVKQSYLANHRFDITIATQGLNKDSSIKISKCWPIKKILLRDIDNNGYDEMYIFTQNAVREGNLIAYNTNHDTQIAAIEIAAFKREGTYTGMDSFYFNKNELIRTFPVPCGIQSGSREVCYRPFNEIYTLYENSIQLLGKDLNRF